MSSHTFRTCLRRQWVREGGEDAVAVRLARANYILHPIDERLQPFQQALNQLNCEIAVTVSADVVKVVASSLPPDAEVFSLTADDHIQIVETMAELGYARAAQHACFIRSEQRLVIWADRVDELEDMVAEFEQKLVAYVFGRTLRPGFHNRATTYSTYSSQPGTPKLPPSPSFTSLIPQDSAGLALVDEKLNKEADGLEAGAPEAAARRLPLNHSIYVGLAVALDFILLALMPRALLHDSLLDGQWIRMATCVVLPLLVRTPLFHHPVLPRLTSFLFAVLHLPLHVRVDHRCLRPDSSPHLPDEDKHALLCVLSLVDCFTSKLICSLLTLTVSGMAPVRKINGTLPHISIVVPVYKESLEEVLAPTIESCSRAISTYELQGGTASIIVCEDGLQLVSPEEVEKRKDYYNRTGCAVRPLPPSLLPPSSSLFSRD